MIFLTTRKLYGTMYEYNTCAHVWSVSHEREEETFKAGITAWPAHESC